MNPQLESNNTAAIIRKATDVDGGHRPEVIVSGWNENDNAITIGSMQKRMRDDFISALNANKWGVVTGSGDSWSYSSGAILTKGTTINTISYLLSKATFRLPFRFCFGITLSQRIANQTFEIGIVSVDETTGIPDEKYIASWLFDGTSQTTNKYRTSSEGSVFDTTQTTTSAAGGGVFDVIVSTDECWFNTGLVDSNSGKAVAFKKHTKLPDPDKLYKLRIRSVNGATAPASATIMKVTFIALEDYAEVMVDSPSLGSSAQGQALPVTISNTPNVALSGTSNSVNNTPSPSSTLGSYSSKGKLISAATTNATSVKNSATNIGKITAENVSASIIYLKLYDKASAPTVGTDTPFHTFALSPSSQRVLDFPQGLRLTTGFAFAITGAIADTDTTAIAANDVIINYEYN